MQSLLLNLVGLLLSLALSMLGLACFVFPVLIDDKPNATGYQHKYDEDCENIHPSLDFHGGEFP